VKNARHPSRRTEAPSRLLTRYGPWAVVTGASDGIGRAFAVELAKAGVNILLAARRGGVLTEIARDLEARFSIETIVVAADLALPTGVDEVVDRTRDLDVGLLVASAGFGTSGPFVGAALSDELEMIDVNCRAVAALSHHFAGRFVHQGRGGIVLMSSLVAFQGVPRAANYAATKAYVQALAEGLRLELAPQGVDVVASAPGPVLSGFGNLQAARGVPGAASEMGSGADDGHRHEGNDRASPVTVVRFPLRSHCRASCNPPGAIFGPAPVRR
jgi:short-subunit dehydrogenase